MNKTKRCLGLLAAAAVIGVSGLAMTTGTATAAEPPSNVSLRFPHWQFIQAYNYDSYGKAACELDGNLSGYPWYCGTIIGDTGATFYALWEWK